MHYHIVGIAGAGMSAIAHILLDQGHSVSGSDLASNSLTAALAARGAHPHSGHNPAYVAGADAVLATAAVSPEHPELAAARAAGIPLLKRNDLWQQWSHQRTIIAVAGTHGKTTTTAMLAWIFERAGRKPGFLIGSESADLGTSARWGNPAAPLIIEADEYDRAFLALRAQTAVITNVEWDHPDIYPTEEDYHQTFAQFVARCEGPVIACGDGNIGRLRETARQVGLPLMTYGQQPANDYQALLQADERDAVIRFCVRHPKADAVIVHTDNSLHTFNTWYQVGIPGLHNIQNALAAVLVADIFGIDATQTQAALRDFHGTARRFELKGEAGGITVIDDYAHHPTEVRATLAAARGHYGQRRIVAYIQPHTYSRTRALLEQWPAAFGDADVVLVGAIYAARETDPGGLHQALAQDLARRVAATHPHSVYVGTVPEATAAAQRLLRPGDVLLTMGAGDGNRVGEALLAALR